MESLAHPTAVSTPENRKKWLSLQVLHVHQSSVINHVDDYIPEGICVHNVSVTQTLEENLITGKQIDVVMVGTDCRLSDIIGIRKITTDKFVPLILHSLKFDWRAKEIALETGVDEYHIGLFDEHFIKRVKLIRRVKLTTTSNKQLGGGSTVKFWLLKRLFDVLFSVMIITTLFPILLIILPMLMFNAKGSMLSSSKRVGMNYKIFDLYKFRYAPSGKEKIVGIWKFLQRIHLIRLPQIINVIKGDMSFIGNYPVSIEDAERLTKDEIAWRFLAPVGIVGLWCIQAEEWDYTTQDIEYAKTNSIWVDIRILFTHFLNLLQNRKDKGMSQQHAFFENTALQSASN